MTEQNKPYIIECIERYYDDYVEAMERRREDDEDCPPTLNKQEYVWRIEGALELCVCDEVDHLVENQDWD